MDGGRSESEPGLSIGFRGITECKKNEDERVEYKGSLLGESQKYPTSEGLDEAIGRFLLIH